MQRFRSVALIVALLMWGFVLAQLWGPVRRAEAQLCGMNPWSGTATVGVCQAAAYIFTGGVQVGATGAPWSRVAFATGTLNGTTEVDVTPTTGQPFNTATSYSAACAPQNGSAMPAGGAISAWVKNSSQVAMFANTPTTVVAGCDIFQH